MWLSHQIGKMQLLLATFWQNDKSNFHIVIVFSKTLSYLGFRSISDGFPLVYIHFTVNNEQTLNNSQKIYQNVKVTSKVTLHIPGQMLDILQNAQFRTLPITYRRYALSRAMIGVNTFWTIYSFNYLVNNSIDHCCLLIWQRSPSRDQLDLVQWTKSPVGSVSRDRCFNKNLHQRKALLARRMYYQIGQPKNMHFLLFLEIVLNSLYVVLWMSHWDLIN